MLRRLIFVFELGSRLRLKGFFFLAKTKKTKIKNTCVSKIATVNYFYSFRLVKLVGFGNANFRNLHLLCVCIARQRKVKALVIFPQ